MGVSPELTREGSPRATVLDRMDERMALSSVLQELTNAALELGGPSGSADAFLDRVAERLGCYAAMLLEVGAPGVTLIGASGIGTASRALAIPPETAGALETGSDRIALPYPELRRPELVAETFPMSAPRPTPFHLVLYFHARPALPIQYRKMVDRLARTLGNVLQHRDLLVRALANERTLDEQKALLECIGEASSVGIVVIGRRGEVLFRNRRFLEMWGLGSEPPMQLAESVLRATSERAADPAGLRERMRALEARADAEAHLEILLADGRVIERRVAPVRSHTGVDLGVGFWDLDVTDRKNAEIERERLLETERAARASAESAIHARDEFLLVASHELRTPLTSMQLVVQSLREAHSRGATLTPAVVLGLLENVERQTRRLSRLVGELLDVSRLQAGRLELTLEEIDLSALCQEVIARFAGELARSGSSVSLDAPSPVIGCWDRSRIDQVVSNLLSNAVKYGGGRPIDVAVSTDGEFALLAVHDRGLGIAPEQIARVFERFERAVSARHYGGLGLGLYIARQIVELHRGVIRVESAPGQGSTFTVALPLRQAT